MALKTQLDHAYQREKQHPDQRWFTQPMGEGVIVEFTWKQAMDQVRRMAAYLKSLDLPPKSHIAIFSKNSAWWIMADLAIWMAGHVSIPLFPTLTPQNIRLILEHSDSRMIFVGKLDGYEAMASGIDPEMKRIVLPLAPKAASADGASLWEDIIAETDPLLEDPTRDPDELATLIYTSGSTGDPKGVMHSFANMTNSAMICVEMFGFNAEDRFLSYLPLAHAFERWILETGTLLSGLEIYFAESLDTFIDDLRRARPTLFISVPRLYQKFQQGVFSKMNPAKLNFLLSVPIIKNIVRKKVLDGLGLAEVRVAGCGTAPAPAELLAWYRKLGLELLEGYGMTENFVHSHICRSGQIRANYAGSPMPGVECKIGENHEILVKSPGNMLGYYKNEALSKESFTEDGYLKTGDQGVIDELNRIKVTGRVKEQFKTSKGKYVSPSGIENKLQLHEHIEMSCVSGAGRHKAFGLVVLSETGCERLKNQEEKNRLCECLETHLNEVNKLHEKSEQLAFLAVISEEWTTANGMLTPTLKLKRASIEERYASMVDGWYEAKKSLIWV